MVERKLECVLPIVENTGIAGGVVVLHHDGAVLHVDEQIVLCKVLSRPCSHTDLDGVFTHFACAQQKTKMHIRRCFFELPSEKLRYQQENKGQQRNHVEPWSMMQVTATCDNKRNRLLEHK